jgi:hypothetical protein
MKKLLHLGFGFLHHVMKGPIKSPVNSYLLPTSLTELAGKEKAEGCLFTISRAQDTIVVVILEFVILSVQDVPHIQSVHYKKPGEDSYLVGSLGVPNPGEGFRRLNIFEGQMVEFRGGVCTVFPDVMPAVFFLVCNLNLLQDLL